MKHSIFSSITSEVPELELESGIKRMVGILNTKGLVTTMSCEGHPQPWIEIEAAHFKGYMKKYPKKMEQFLRAGEGSWYLQVHYFAQSKFRGLGSIRPRLNKMKRIVLMNMSVTITFHSKALEQNLTQKKKSIRAMERAALKHL